MKANQKDLLAGLCILVGLAGIAVLVVWLFSPASAGLPWRQTSVLQVVFERPTKLRPGTAVTVGGTPIGRVRNVSFADPDSLAGGMRVELAINRDCHLRRGTWARCTEVASGGRAALELVPGAPEEPPLKSGATIRGDVISSISALLSPEVVSSIDRAAVRVGDAADMLAGVLDDFRSAVRPTTPNTVDQAGGPPGNLASALARLDTSLRSLNELVGDDKLRTELKDSVHNLYAVSTDGRQLVTDARAALDEGRTLMAASQKLVTGSQSAVAGAEQQIGDVSRGLSDALNLASSLLKELDGIVARISRGEGSLGKMIHDDQLYDALLMTLRRTAAEKP